MKIYKYEYELTKRLLKHLETLLSIVFILVHCVSFAGLG